MTLVRDHAPSEPGVAPGPPRARRRRGRAVLAWAVGALLGAAPLSGAAAAPPVPAGAGAVPGAEAGRYVVTLAADPLAGYDGGVPGIPAPKSSRTGRVDLRSAPARAYRAHLERRQSEVAAVVGARPLQRYTVALNGFSAELSARQARKLAATPGVLSVVADTRRHLDTTDTPGYLGLTGDEGVWAGLGGPENAGEGVVVGVIDSGVWPEHPSFAGQPLPSAPTPGEPHLAYWSGEGRITQAKKDGDTFTGTCETGEGWALTDCSTKIVGARAFGEGFFAEVEQLGEAEFRSPRDGDGHGSHTAGTAVGEQGVDAVIDGVSYGEASGMAPGASLAVYKACWSALEEGLSGCQTSDVVAAVDAAVADGVDVINLSLGSGAATTVVDPIELAFLSAASAGVFVAASAGNSGPDASTLDHASPWITTVAAATAVPREGTVVLGNGRTYVGASINPRPIPQTSLVHGRAAAHRGAAADAVLCLDGSLDPARVRGRIVICEAGGEVPGPEKAEEVARAGGTAMVFVEPGPTHVIPGAYAVPTIRIGPDAGAKVTRYARLRRATAAFEPGNVTGGQTPHPQLAPFSSRGPTLAVDGDVLKPDLAAPGVGVLAAVAPGPNRDNLFSAYSGTSMSAPHVAGLAALVFDRHPGWSPMAVKSAMMTTARDLLGPDGRPRRLVFDAGAGFVDPQRFLDPGLVYESTPEEWIGFLEGSGTDTGTGVPALDPSDLNQPSIAIGSLVGSQTVTRSVTAVTPGLYFARASIPGVHVRVSPSILHFSAAGETKTFRVTFTATTAATAEYASGHLTWRGAGRTVRSPLAVRPVPLSAPEQVRGAGAAGSADVTVSSGTTGEIDLLPLGMVEGEVGAGELAQDDVAEHVVEVPAGTALARFEVTAADPRADLDLVVLHLGEDGTVTEAGAALTPAADEHVDVVDPQPGTYVAVVYNFAAPGEESTAAYEHTAFVLHPHRTEGRLTARPDPLPVTLGRPATYTVGWEGLDPAGRYLGVVAYGSAGPDRVGDPTVVAVN